MKEEYLEEVCRKCKGKYWNPEKNCIWNPDKPDKPDGTQILINILGECSSRCVPTMSSYPYEPSSAHCPYHKKNFF